MLTPELRDQIGQAIYEPEKGQGLNLSIAGTVIEWTMMNERQREVWCKRAEVAIQAYLEAQSAPLEGTHASE